MQQLKVTLQDVANEAGVSKATASLAISNNSRISDSTRQRVLEAVEKLGYIYDRRAASLRTQQSYTIGLVITDITNPFYAELTSGIEEELKAADYVVLLGSTSDDTANQQRLFRTMQERSADGVILCPARDTPLDAIEAFARQIPTVLVTRYVSGTSIDYVGIDNELGARRAVSHLIENGHRRIAFVGGPDGSSARRDRLAGYASILEKHDIAVDPDLTVTSPVSRNGGYEAIRGLVGLADPPTAAICYNDVVAFGAMLGLRQVGIEPGRDFAVVGFDDVTEASLWTPSLSSVASTPMQIGEEAAQLLLDRIANPAKAAEQVIVPSRLIIRASSQVQRPT